MELAETARRQRWGTAAAVTATILLTAWAINLLNQREPPPPVEQQQAEALLQEAFRFAQAGDYEGLCESVASVGGTCRFLLESARNGGWEPGPEIPQIVGTTRSPNSLILHLTGTRLDRSTYTADFEVIREGPELRSRTPVYWSGVQVSQNTSCRSSNNQVTCTDTSTATR